jgi:DNA replication licensing factor MCM5
MDKNMALHIMKLHMGGSMEVEEHFEIDLQDLKQYIAYTKSRSTPRLNEPAEKLLENLYVQDREMTSGDASAIPITVRQLEAVIRISESLAKMSMAEVVTVAHVEEAHRIFQVSTLNAA